MKRPAVSVISILIVLLTLSLSAVSQTVTAAGEKTDSAALDALSKKIDLQNAKIDALSQQILKLQQQISATRPGIMIGETPASVTATTDPPRPVQTGNTHVVAKGETLTSIAKMHKVTIEELQRLNHIENDRKLQIGQTIIIPSSASAAASPTPPPGG
jgi:peptidoglycan endopeptidase LytE